MPANTPNGLPYPLGTDRVMDGDDAIKNLATGIRATQGIVTMPAGTGGRTLAITFPAGLFTVPPAICVTSHQSPFITCSVNVAPTTSGAVLNAVYRTSTGATGDGAGSSSVAWIATQIGS